MTKENSPVLIFLSALFATFLSCILACFVLKMFLKWDQLGASIRFWVVFASIYAAILTISGWIYQAKGRRFAGFMHAALMSGIAGLGLLEALFTLSNKSIMGAAAPMQIPLGASSIHRFRVLTVTTSAARVKSLLEACSRLKRGHGLFLFTDRTVLEKDLFAAVWQSGKTGEKEPLLDLPKLASHHVS